MDQPSDLSFEYIAHHIVLKDPLANLTNILLTNISSWKNRPVLNDSAHSEDLPGMPDWIPISLLSSLLSLQILPCHHAQPCHLALTPGQVSEVV